MNRFVCCSSLLLFASVLPAFAAVSVSTPGNGAEVTSPFELSADASECSSQPIASMGYSLDSSTDTTIVDGTSINASVPASTGAHTLHVKSWGDKGASCVTDVALTVTGASSSSSSSNSGSSDGITVGSPGNGATVGSPFTLSASASTCSSQAISAMGYSLDNSSDTTTVKSKSVSASISATAGAHTLHVKSWGDGGAGCVANIAITVSGGSSPTPVANTASAEGISVTSPGNGADLSTPFDVKASAGSCDSQTVTAMGYSLDSSSDTTTVSGTSLNASVATSAGAHTLHVKSWGDKGAGCVANVAVTVGSASAPAASSSIAPADATSNSSLQTLGAWKEADDGGTSGKASGSMALVSSPTLAGNSRRFITSFSGGGGERYYVSFGDDTTSENFLYDAYVYFTSTGSEIGNLEMDMNQVMPNGDTVIYGFQCDGYNGTWDYTRNSGSSPKSYNDSWVHSKASCNPRNWSRDTWHHVQIEYSRNSSGDVTYKAVWLDGAEQAINATVPSAFALGWAPSLVTNFQVDGLNSGSTTVYLDKLTVYRW